MLLCCVLRRWRGRATSREPGEPETQHSTYSYREHAINHLSRTSRDKRPGCAHQKGPKSKANIANQG